MATFPQATLPVSVWIAPGGNPALPSTWNWVEITSDVRVSEQIQGQLGRQDEGSQVGPSAIQLTMDCRSGNYSPRNPLGIWFGLLGKGTPIQYRVTRINDTFTRTVASGLGTDSDSGLTWTAGASTYAVNGSAATATFATANGASTALVTAGADDVDVTHVSSVSAVMTGAAYVDATVVRYADGSNLYRLHTEFGTGGAIGCKIVRVVGGITSDLTVTTPAGVTYAANTRVRTRVQAIGATLRIKAWLDGNAEPAAWTIQVDDTAVAGRRVGLYQWRVAGNTNAGSVVCTLDDYRMDAIRVTCTVPEWPVRWDQSAKVVTVPISGAGILRRLSQGQSALHSPLYRQLTRYTPTGFWPLEDGSNSTAAASAVSGVRSAKCLDVSFGSDGPSGADGAITLNSANSAISGSCSGPNTPDGYAGLIFAKLSALPPSATELTLMTWTGTGTVQNWRVTANNVGLNVYGTAADGTSIVATGATSIYTMDPTKWWSMQLDLTEVGGNVNWELDWNQVGTSPFYTVGGSYAGTADRPTGFKATGIAGTSYSMAWVGDNDLPYVTVGFLALAAGYSGELAGDRLTRLCAEEGIPLVVAGATATTAPMGAQTAATFLDLAREIEDADQGVIIERGAGLGYLTREDRYNVPVTMALDFNSGHVSAPPEPVDDDQRLRNQIVLSRTGGSQETATDPVSVASAGIYSDELTVNLAADSQLLDQAYWRLHLGTIDELRWPRIELQLHRNPSLINTWVQMGVGSRITIANPPAAVAGASLDLVVEGWTETLGPYSWDVALVCSPARPWDVGVYDATTARYDSATTTTSAALTSGATTVPIATTDNRDAWSITAVPYDWKVTGERMTVTRMSAVGSLANADGNFETGGLVGWGGPSGGTFVPTATQAHSGFWSGLLTTTGTPTQTYVRNSPALAVTAGTQYRLVAWMKSLTALANAMTAIDWFDSGGNYLSTSSQTASLVATVWTLFDQTFTAPAGAAFATYGPTLGSSPATGSAVYVDEVDFLQASGVTGFPQIATVTRAVNGIAKTHAAGETVSLADPARYAL